MNQPRILFVDHAGVLGGAELYLLDVARHYRATSKVVLFEDGPFRTRLEEANVEVEVVPAATSLRSIKKESGWMGGLYALPALIQPTLHLARQARPFDVLYANSQKALIAAALASAWARSPLVWNLHDILTAEHFSAFNRRVAVWFANRFATRVIANSHATRDAFAASGGDRDRCGVVYNGIDPASFTSFTAGQLQHLRSELGLSGHLVVGMFSRLAPWKGQHVLLEALSDLPHVQALFVGSALFEGDESYANALHRRVSALELQDRVHFLGFRDDVPTLMQLVDVVVHASTAPEPFGRVIAEAMLAGTPVVATRAGGAAEIVDTGRTGLLVEPGDPTALRKALRDLLDGRARARTLARTARSEAFRRFSVSTMLNAIDYELANLGSG